MMEFKAPELKDQFFSRPLFLKLICSDFLDYCRAKFGFEPECTRVLEKVEGSTGVHEAGRAVDFRDEHPKGKFLFTPEQQLMVTDFINKKYMRNDGHPTILFHSFCNGAFHAHIQMASSMDAYKKEKAT